MIGIQLLTDDFHRADENPLSNGGLWVGMSGYGTSQVVSEICEPSINTFPCMMFNVGGPLPRPNDMYGEIIVAAGALGQVGVGVRMLFTQNAYFAVLQDGSATNGIYRLDPSFIVTPLAVGAASVSPNDVWRLVASGSTLTLFQNGIKRYQATDATYSSGGFGAGVYQNISGLGVVPLSASQISRWAYGSAVLSLPIIFFSGSTCTITASDDGASITFTTDGSTPIPGSHGALYTGPFFAIPGTTVKAVSSLDGYTTGAVAILKNTGAINAPSVYAIMRNARMYTAQRLQSRPGMSLIQSGYPSAIHSIRRLNDPFTYGIPVFTRILGAGNSLFISGSFGSTTPIDMGYSGNPLALVPFRPPNSPQAWMYVGDSSRMRKVRVDGANYQMGIAPPLSPPSAELGVPAINSIDDFDAVGAWTPSGTAGALSVIARNSSIFLSGIPVVPDTPGYVTPGGNAFGPGWVTALIAASNLKNVRPGEHLKITQTGGGNPSEEVLIQEVIPYPYNPSSILTVTGIAYDGAPTNTGPCTITLSAPQTIARAYLGYVPSMDDPAVAGTSATRAATTNTIGIRPNLILNLGSTEVIRVISVSQNPDGTISIRAVTGVTHSVGEPAFFNAAIRFYVKNAYDGGTHSIVASDNALQSTIAAGIGLLSETTPLDLSVFAGQRLPIQEDDIVHISFLIDDAASLIEFRLVFDVSSSGFDFQHEYFFKSWSASDIQQALASAVTVQSARQTSFYSDIINQNLGFIPVSIARKGGAVILPPSVDPATVSLQPGTNVPAASKLNPAGLSSWAELTCKVSDLTKVGSDATATLAGVQGVRIYINVSASAVCAVDSLYLTGAYGPDVGDTGVPYLYRYQPRSSITGAKGYPSPPTRSGIEPHRQAIEVDCVQHPDPQVTDLDVYRWGGTLPQWTFVGSCANSVVPFFLDEQSDLGIGSNPLLSFDNLQPFPTIDLPQSGFVNVVGTTVTWISGSPFNTQWAQGTQININGLFYTFYAQPSSSKRVEIVENGGTQSGVPYFILEATVLGQPLPALWGPYSQGTALYLFACGDLRQPGVLFLTNGNDADSASDIYQIEITTPSEPLMNGCLYNEQSYVWSSERAFFLYPSFGSGVVIEAGSLLPAQGTNLFVPIPIPNGKGLFARYALVAGPKMWFRARDGIYETTGGEPSNITLAELSLLFPHDGQPGVPVSVGTFTIYPPDDSSPALLNAQRLSYYDSHLYFDYIDTQGNRTTLVANTATQPYVWTKDDYTPSVLTHYGEEGQGVHSLLLGGSDGGLWQSLGIVDGNSAAFPFEARMPQMSELVGGFQHIREGYLGLIDSADASLVINADGSDNLVTLPAVNGNYARIYTPTPALKARLFAWGLLGLSPFALFLRDCQFSIRTWSDDGAFQPINPFSQPLRAAQPKVQ
jgi:hypothetical protein